MTNLPDDIFASGIRHVHADKQIISFYFSVQIQMENEEVCSKAKGKTFNQAVQMWNLYQTSKVLKII